MKIEKIMKYIRECTTEQLQVYLERVCGVVASTVTIDNDREYTIEWIHSTLNRTLEINITNLYDDICRCNQ